jgi:hypothetical protein
MQYMVRQRGGGPEITQVLVPTGKFLHVAPLDEEARYRHCSHGKMVLVFVYFLIEWHAQIIR